MLINISPSNIFLSMLLPAIFHQNGQAVLAVASINGLILSNLGHFLIVTIFMGSAWPTFSENTLMLYQQDLQLVHILLNGNWR